MFKLGFTTWPSVEQRFAYKGSGDEKYIDKVLFFEHFEDALEMETTLHAYFRRKATFCGSGGREQDMPLFQNGQTEIYIQDILDLDYSSDRLAQEWQVRESLCRFRCKRIGQLSDQEIELDIRHERISFELENKPKEPIALQWPMTWIVKFYSWFEGGQSKSEARLREAAEEVIGRIDSIRMNERLERSKRLAQLKKKIREV